MNSLKLVAVLLAAFGIFAFGAGIFEIISNLQNPALSTEHDVDALSPIIHAGMGAFFIVISRIIWVNRLKL